MKVSQNIQLQGRFKFDLYDRSGNFKSSTNYFNNFITPTGLHIYPTTLAFADCFRYISLGSGTAVNTVLGNGTTGLSTPLPNFSYIGGNLSEVDGQNQYDLNGCGYREHQSGVTLSRAWRIPTGDTNFFSGDYTFKEMMLSPGKPLDGLSMCNELSDLLSLYPSICTYTKAFSRVIKDVSVSKDDYLIGSYELNISTNTGVNSFTINVNNAGRALGSDPNNWGGNVSGVYSLIHHGIKLIRGGDTTFLPFSVNQQYFFDHYGDSFNPPLGSPLEPSTNKGQYTLYLSTDDTQFLVSEISGAAMNTGLYFPYNVTGKPFPSGVERFHTQPTFETALGNNIPYWLVNIRRGGGAFFPCPNDYTTACDESIFSPALMSIVASNYNVQFNTFNNTDRTRTKNINAEFTNINAGAITNQPIRSMVFSYKNRDGTDLYPFFDLILAPKNAALLPTMHTGINSLSYDIATNGFSYLDGINNLTLEFQLSWSSPCNASVNGC